MKYIPIETIGPYQVCRHHKTGALYVSGYDPACRKTFYRSLHTKSIEHGIVAVRNLVNRGITGDPKGELRKKPLQTVGEVLDWHLPSTGKNASNEQDRISAKRIKRMMGSQRISALVPEIFETFRDDCLAKENISLSTVSRTLTTLRAALKRAFENKRLAIAFAPKVPEFMTKALKRSAEPKGRPMGIEEFASQIDAIGFLHEFIAQIYLLNTAGRISSILELQANQIDAPHRLINLNPIGRTQTNKYRPILPLTDTLRPWALSAPPGHLIRWNGEPIEEIDTAFAASCRRANLPGGENTYSVRHSVGRFMQTQRVPAEEISIWLGHIQPPTSSETTIIYSPYRPDYLINARRAVEEFVRQIDAASKRDLLNPPWIKSGND